MMTPTLSSRPVQQQSNLFNTISRTALMTGILSAVASIIKSYMENGQGHLPFITFLTQGGPAHTFKYIASGAFGNNALSGGMLMIVWGVVFHFMIAFVFTAILFLLYPVIIRRIKNKWVTGILFSLFIWFIMNIGILPLSSVGKIPFDAVHVFTDIVILIVTIGMPAVLVAHQYYRKKKGTTNYTN